MKVGSIVCMCGKSFSFETARDTVACIDCKKVHDVTGFPEKEEVPEEPIEEPEEG